MNKHRLALGMIGIGLFVTGVGIGAFIIDNKKERVNYEKKIS